jgi:hypothetical protein
VSTLGSPRAVVHAAPRAVEAAICLPIFQELGETQEFSSAGLTDTLDSQFSLAVNYEEWGVLEAIALASPDVATLARRDEVFWSVVPLIAIDMIGDQTSLGGSTTGSPGHGDFAPVTGVGARSDLLPQDQAVLGDVAGWSAERMVASLAVLVRGSRHVPSIYGHGV